MSQKEVFNKFKLYFPKFADASEMWFPNGKNSVRVRLNNRKEVVFTFNSELDWRFETVESFMKSMVKGGIKK